MGETLEARMAALEAKDRADDEHRIIRDREIKGIKDTLTTVDGKLDKLIEDKIQRDTAISMGKWLVGTGFLAWCGGGLLWLWEMVKATGR